MAQFALLVTAHPWSSQGQYSALQYAQALLRKGHQLHSIFFSADAVIVANKMNSVAGNELDLCQAWTAVKRQSGAALLLCSSAASRQGLIATDQSASLIAPAFEIAGLGSWVEASLLCERTVHFAGAAT